MDLIQAKSLRTILIVSLLLAALVSAKTASQIAQPFDRPEYVPAASDVTIRSLNFRPMDKNDPHDSLDAMTAFHATRLEWVYLRFNDKEKILIDQVKEMGRVFGTTGNSNLSVEIELAPGREYIAYSMLDINGEPIIVEHSRHWAIPMYPGCVNNPSFTKRDLEYYLKNVDYGTQTIQRDDPGGQYYYALSGQGCFCEFCMKDFCKYLKKHMPEDQLKEQGINSLENFHYGNWLRSRGFVNEGKFTNNPLKNYFVDFQMQSIVQFYKDIRTAINIHAKQYIPFSCNNTSYQRWDEDFYHCFDFAISELMVKSAEPVHIYERSQKARSLGKIQVFGSPKTLGKEYSHGYLTELKRKVIATTYAVGALSRVPWDIFEQTKDGKGRYFGKPENYADLYGFVRANDRYLSGYQDAGAFGPGLNETRYGSETPIRFLYAPEKTYAFIRSVPLDQDAPVVIHLVNWSENQNAFEIELQNDNFFPSSRLDIKLIRPVAYNQTLHEQAEAKALAMLAPGEYLSGKQAPAYKTLSETITPEYESNTNETVVQIPSITPWAILVIEEDK